MSVSAKTVATPLLDLESSRLLKDEFGITTITFYRGSRETAAESLRKRLVAIVGANPWLCGRIVHDRTHRNLQLVHSPIVSEFEIERLIREDDSSIRVGSRTPYSDLCRVLKPAVVRKGFNLINKQETLTRLTIATDSDSSEDGFAVIFSLSHLVADGDTYYQIFNALFSEKPVPTLDIQRNQDASDRGAASVGKNQNKLFHSLPFVWNILRGMLFGKRTKCFARYIDEEAIAKDKAAYTRCENGMGFISTNDIVTSRFANVVNGRFCIMVVNFRDRIAGLASHNAGNYEGGLLLDKGVYSKPESIRSMLQNGPPYVTTSGPLPGVWESMWCRFCFITSWMSFAGDTKLPQCREVLHLPLYDPRTFPTDIAVVFRPCANRTAMMFFVKNARRSDILFRCELGSQINPDMFPER